MTHQRRRSAWLTSEFSILLSDSLPPSHTASISKGNNNLATIYMRSLILWLKALVEAQTHCFTSFKSMYQLDSGCKTFNDVLQTAIIIMLRILQLKTTKSINAITMFHNSSSGLNAGHGKNKPFDINHWHLQEKKTRWRIYSGYSSRVARRVFSFDSAHCLALYIFITECNVQQWDWDEQLEMRTRHNWYADISHYSDYNHSMMTLLVVDNEQTDLIV